MVLKKSKVIMVFFVFLANELVVVGKRKVNNMSNESMKNVCYDHFGKRAHYSISGGPSMASLSRERTKREENEGHCSTLGSSFIVRVVVAIYSW